MPGDCVTSSGDISHALRIVYLNTFVTFPAASRGSKRPVVPGPSAAGRIRNTPTIGIFPRFLSNLSTLFE